jgi:hypothetical protein
MSVLSIREIKDEVLRQVHERQAYLERGEYDVPLGDTPLPLARLLDLLGQWEYRRDFLDLAVPPPVPGLGARLKRFLKKTVTTSLRWLLIRQVEFNSAALEHARVLTETLTQADRHRSEVVAAVLALKLQVHALTQRLARLEPSQASEFRPQGAVESLPDKSPSYQAYLEHFREYASVLDLDSGRGEFLKFLMAEGIPARGCEPDPALAEYCRDRELPVVCTDSMTLLGQLAEASLGGIHLGPTAARLPPHELVLLLARCWTKLDQGGVLIAEAANPGCAVSSTGPQILAEWLAFLFERQGFTVVDHVFSLPISAEAAVVARTAFARPFDQRQYQCYAVVGRKGP